MRRDELRPVIDPALPEDIAAQLRTRPWLLYRRGQRAHRWPRSATTQAIGAGVTLSATGVLMALALSAPAAATALVLLLVLVLTGAFTQYVGRQFFDEPWESWFLTPWWSVWIIGSGVAFLTWLGEGAASATGLAAALPATTDQLAAAGILGLSGGLTTAILARPRMPTLLATRHRSKYLCPADFGTEVSEARRMLRGDRPAAEAELLWEVQVAIDRVAAASVVLDSGFDGAQSLAVLREQEWAIAQDLVRHRKLRESLDARYANAATDRVVAALRPQEEALYRAHTAIVGRVGQARAYGEQVDTAVLAHREWEQCADIAAANDDFADLIASATCDPFGSAALDQARTEAEAAREVRDERVREAVAAGAWLTRAMNAQHSEGPLIES